MSNRPRPLKACQHLIVSATSKDPWGDKCGAVATWAFRYKFAERLCVCKDRNCVVSSPAVEGETYFCDKHAEERNPPAPDNLIPLEEQWRNF